MRTTRWRMAATACVAISAMVLAACSGSTGSTESSGPGGTGGGTGGSTPTGGSTETGGANPSGNESPTSSGGGGYPNDDTITEAYEQEWYSYNQFTPNGNATANANVLNPIILSFTNIDPHGKQVPNKELGSIEKTSDDPLTVKYTFNPKAVWSDGEDMGCADFLLLWEAMSGHLNKDGSVNDDPSKIDPDKLLFASASTSGWDQTKMPDCSVGDKTVTLVYDKPFVDWSTIGGEGMPAHVVAKQAGMSTEDLVTAIKNDDADALGPAAEFWNTGWDLDKDKGLPDKSILVSGGPYMVSAWQPGQSVTLTANPKWWGTPAKTGTIVERFIPQEQQVQALQSGEVDVIEPQPTTDVLKALKGMGDKVTTQVAQDFTYEHFDLSTKNAFKNDKLREALFKCAPRQQIVDNLIKPVDPNAKILESLMLQPLMDGYDQLAKNSGFAAYDKPDIAGAKKAFEESGAKKGIKIRAIHISPNDRRDNEVALLKASCDPVGFDIENTPLSSDKFGPALTGGDYDLAVFAWAGSGLFGAIPALYMSNGAQNFSGWKGDQKLDDALSKVLTTVDQSKIPDLLQTADQEMAKNHWSLPLFAFPGLTAFGSDIAGVQHTAAQTGATWNVQDWVRKGK